MRVLLFAFVSLLSDSLGAFCSRRDVDDTKAASLLDLGPLGTDFSLKQGEKITIKVNVGGAAAPSAAGAGAKSAVAGGGGLLKLRGPGEAAPASHAAPAPAPAPAAAGSSDWETF